MLSLQFLRDLSQTVSPFLIFSVALIAASVAYVQFQTFK
jgi:hypothetical protein